MRNLNSDAQDAIRRRWARVPDDLKCGPYWQSSTTGHYFKKDHHPVHILNSDKTKTLCARPKGRMRTVTLDYVFDPVVDCVKCRAQALIISTGAT